MGLSDLELAHIEGVSHARARSSRNRHVMQTNPDQSKSGTAGAAPAPAPARPHLPDVELPPAARNALSPQAAAKMVERLRALCRTQTQDVTDLEEATRVLRLSGYKQELSQLFRDAIWWPDAHPHVGALWMRRLLSSNNWDRRYPKVMDELCRRGDIGHRAVLEFLQTVPSKNRMALVRQAVRKHGRWLRADPAGWGVAARALVAVRLYRLAVKWMADWRKRPELDLPLLQCLAVALRGAGREKHAEEVVGLALQKPDSDQRFTIFHLWEAEEKGLAGETAAAAAHFKQVVPEGWDDDELVLYYLTRGVIRVQRADAESRSETYRGAYHRIHDQLGRRKLYKCDKMLRRQYRRCLCRMARDSGKTGSGIMTFWRSADSWATVGPLLVIPGLQLFLPVYLLRLCTNPRGRSRRSGEKG